MLLGSDLAAALSSSSRGTSPGSPLAGASPLPARLRFRQASLPQQRSPLPQHRSSASIFRPANDCRHFHYDTVELGPVRVELLEEDGEAAEEKKIIQMEDNNNQRSLIMRFSVESNGKQWTIARTFADLCQLDRQLHRCVFSREHSRLQELIPDSPLGSGQVRLYMQRLSLLTGSLMRCYPVLSFFELDNRGNHFHPAEYSKINVPAIACAVAIRPFASESNDHLELRVGDIVSVVEMDMEEGREGAAASNLWWRGKLTVPGGRSEGGGQDTAARQNNVGSFPASCVRLFSDRLSLGEQIWLASQPKPGGRRRSSAHKLLASPTPRLKSLLRMAIPSPRTGGGVFGRELSSFGSKVPPLVLQCVALIEKDGLVPGIYRQCGVQSNIRRLRREFDSVRSPPQWDSPQLAQLLGNDIHSVPSMLKQYFRQLPDPLLCFQLHPRLIATFSDGQSAMEAEQSKVSKVRALLEEMPLSHLQTARCLFTHLQRISRHSQTEMNARSLAIVWAPNLIRCPPAQVAEWPNQLAGLDIHTDICAFLISNADAIFGQPAEDAIPAALPNGKDTEQPMTANEEEVKRPLTQSGGRKRSSLVCGAVSAGISPIGNGAVHSVIDRPRNEDAPRRRSTMDRAKWRRMLQNGANSVTSILGRANQRQQTFGQSRSQSVDQPASPRAQRLLSPLSASVMRRVRSVRDSVKKFRPGHSSTATSPCQQPTIEIGVPFMDDDLPNSPCKHSSATSAADTVKEAEKFVNFGHGEAAQQLEDEEELLLMAEDGAESVDSLPLDISRYDNVQSNLLHQQRENGRLYSPPEEVAQLKAKLRPLTLAQQQQQMDEGEETIYF